MFRVQLTVLAWAAMQIAIAEPAQARQPEALEARIERVRLDRINRDGLELEAVLTIQAPSSITIRSMRFWETHAGDVPLTVTPVTDPFRVEPGQVTEVALRVLLRFEDMPKAATFHTLITGRDLPIQSFVEAELGAPLWTRIWRGARVNTVSFEFHDAVAIRSNTRIGSVKAVRP